MPTVTRSICLPRTQRTLPYELERKSVKNFNLRVRPDGTIHLSVPRSTTIAAAEAFLHRQEDWLLRALAKVEARAASHPSAAVTNSLPYLGGTLSIVWQEGHPAQIEANMEACRLTVTLPNPDDPDQRTAAIETFERQETHLLVTALIERYFPLFEARGVPAPRSIRVKRLKSRFGSCAPQNLSLNFALRLCEYPLPFVEYVVVHELCHFLEANHSARFWAEVEGILPDWQVRERLGKG